MENNRIYRFSLLTRAETAPKRPFIAKIRGKMRFMDSEHGVYEWSPENGFVYLYRSLRDKFDVK